MDRRVIVVLAVALGAALLIIVFLLGRSSGRTAPSASAPAGSDQPAPGSGLPPDAPRPIEAAPAAGDPTAGPLATLGGTEATALADDGYRAQVARYFEELDAIQRDAKAWHGDPTTVAQAILQQAAEGKTSDFDALIESNRMLLVRLEGISAPPPCVEHHRRSVGTVGEGLHLLERVRSSLADHSVAELEALTVSGRDIEKRAAEIDAMAVEIKKRYGL